MGLKFSDGVEVDTSGPLRPLRLKDGWYVCGTVPGAKVGILVAAGSQKDAEWMIKDILFEAGQRNKSGEGGQ